MKRKVCVVVLVIFFLCLFAGCSAQGPQTEASPLVGTWEGTDLLADTFEFKADGTGHNENTMLPYDFKYDTEGDKLNIYAQLFGMDSDEAMVYSYSIDGDVLTLIDESLNITYEYAKLN